MLSESSKTLFCELFIYLARGEKKIEVIRQVLCEISDFEPYSAFKRLTTTNKNYLTAQDLTVFLADNDIYYPEEVIADTFVSHYDFDFDGKLCYAEFLRAVLPGDHPVLRTEVSQRPINEMININGRLRDTVEYTLAKLLNEEISLYYESEPQKLLLHDAGNFSSAVLFSLIDQSDSGFIDFNNLNEFFESQGIYPYEEEIISILKRFDKDDDGRITLQEFKAGLSPKNIKVPIAIRTSPLKIISPKRRSPEKSLLSPSKNYPFQAIRRANSPVNQEKALFSNKSNKLASKSPKRAGSSLKKSEKTMSDLKNEVSRDLNISKRIEALSPFKRKTPERRNHQSFHQEDNRKNATDTKISYKALKKSPLNRKKFSNLDNLKRSLEKQMEISKKINQTFHKKSETLMSTLGKLEKFSSPIKEKSPRFHKEWSELVDFFKKIIGFEREIERIKQDLALRPDFNLMDFFAIYDKNEKGYLNQNEIKGFLESLSINPQYEAFNLFLRKFDRNNFGRFKFCDFVEIFTPCQSDYADLLRQRKPQNYENKFTNVYDLLSADTRQAIQELLSKIIENERDIENERKVLIKVLGNQLRDIFEAIDFNKNGVLSLKELKTFLEHHETFITERDAMNLFNRFDHYKKGTISYAEFIQELQHKLP